MRIDAQLVGPVSSPLMELESPASLIRQAIADQLGSALQDLHPGLSAEHPLLIGSQYQRLLAGHVVRLGADVTFSIKEQHPQQLACGKLKRVDVGHGCAGDGAELVG